MRNWLITGISSGIGRALAEAALARGDMVVGTARREADLQAFTALAPGIAHGVLLDVADRGAIEPAIDRALALAGGIDIAVNNAGCNLFGAMEEVSISELQALLDVNLFGPWLVTQAILPHFRSRHAGTLINISSGCGLAGMAGMSAYCASKFALEGWTEAVAQEVAGFGIRTMLVEPGAILTRFISASTQEASRRLPDYAFLSAQGKSVLNAYYETAASPPERVASAILDALDAPELPLHLLVGDDVRVPARARFSALLAAAQ